MHEELFALLAAARDGKKRAISRLITRVELGGAGGMEARRALWEATGRARILGVTGPPGAGKSTLTDKLAKWHREQGRKVGIVAVDPTSPFTGGAILGDRVRMGDLTLDEGVFIRSMGTRGQLGGLSAACAGAVNVLDACGFDLIILETVGVGQSEVAVAAAADLVMVLMVPGLGDDIQAIKAGILEIGDLFVVNKADRPGADLTAAQLRAALELDPDGEKRALPVLLTSAAEGGGVDALCETVERRFGELTRSGELERRRQLRLRQELLDLVQNEFNRRILGPIMESERFEREFDDFLARRGNPYEWAERMMESLINMREAER